MVLYLLNALITPFQDNEATFMIRKITVEEARLIFWRHRTVVSAIGHESAAKLLELILEAPVPVNRISVFFNPGDEGLALVLRKRLPEGQVVKSIEELSQIGYDLYHIIRIS